MCFGEEMSDRERYGLFLVNHTYAHNCTHNDTPNNVHASKWSRGVA